MGYGLWAIIASCLLPLAYGQEAPVVDVPTNIVHVVNVPDSITLTRADTNWTATVIWSETWSINNSQVIRTRTNKVALANADLDALNAWNNFRKQIRQAANQKNP